MTRGSHRPILPMTTFSRRPRAALVVLAIVLTAVWTALAIAHPPPEPPRVDLAAEALIHTPPGFAHEGKPAVYRGDNLARLQVTIVDRATGQPTYCRVNVVGADGNFYEPQENVLAPWSLHRLGNRPGKGPFRYYGWFFYTPGTFEVEVPPGATQIEVWRGYEYRPLVHAMEATAGASKAVKLELDRLADMSLEGYYSGDTHIHLYRRNETDDARALDLIAAEDIGYGTLLSHNLDGKTYSGRMDRQGHEQLRGFGQASVLERGSYAIASGQEYVCSTYGHICLFLHRQMVLEGLTVEPNRWPLLGMLGQETRKLGGYSFHAHGGYANEIYADFAQRALDGVELLQFAEYRGIALEGWYKMLNIGYRFPAVGACDYPYCRALGDCRTYVYSPTRPTFTDWARRAAEGRSFFTTGPLVLLEVDGQRPGEVIRQIGDGAQKRKVRARVRSEVAPVTHVEFVVNGRSVARREVSADRLGQWINFDADIDVQEPTWIAARSWSDSPPGRPDAEAHTNPVYISVNGKLPYRAADLEWLLERLEERIAAVKARQFEEQAAALEFFAASKRALEEIRTSGGQKVD
jgi:hypothetical protein